MSKLNLAAGTKVDMTALVGSEELEFKSSFFKETGGNLLFSTPLSGGKPFVLKAGTILHLGWLIENTQYALDASVTGSLKQGIRTYVVATATDEVQRSDRRAFTRIAAELDVELLSFDTLPDGTRASRNYPGRTSDVSNGGIAVYTNAPMAVGEIVDVTIARRGTKKLSLRGTVCWTRPAPRTVSYRDSAGIQFLLLSAEETAAVSKLTTSLAAKQA